MYKHTITRVRPNVNVEWPSGGGDGSKININQKYNLFESTIVNDSELTRSISRQSIDPTIFTAIENDLANTSSNLYWITQHCIDNGITSTYTLEEI